MDYVLPKRRAASSQAQCRNPTRRLAAREAIERRPMIFLDTPRILSRRTVLLTTGIFLIAATEGALARGSGSGGGVKGPAFGPAAGAHAGMTIQGSSRDHGQDRRDGFFDRHKDKDNDRHAGKCRHPAPGACGTDTIHPIPSPNPKPTPANPPANPPVVRDHRPGGNAAGPAPGTIIRDHRNGADGKPVVVVRSGGGVTVTRPATSADLQKAGLQPKPAPFPITVPIGALGGGR
jgi:hypothetical protein